MKKFLLIIFCILLSSSITGIAQDFSDEFVEAFGSCKAFNDSGNFTTENMNVTSSKRIYGYNNNLCKYEESIKMGETKAKVSCNFSKAQIDEITEVMKAYNLVQKYSDEQLDTSSLDNVKNNPVFKVWSKYLQDENVCKINLN